MFHGYNRNINSLTIRHRVLFLSMRLNLLICFFPKFLFAWSISDWEKITMEFSSTVVNLLIFLSSLFILEFFIYTCNFKIISTDVEESFENAYPIHETYSSHQTYLWNTECSPPKTKNKLRMPTPTLSAQHCTCITVKHSKENKWMAHGWESKW